MGWFVDCEDIEFLQTLAEDVSKVVKEGDPQMVKYYAELSRAISALLEVLDPWKPY